jgi:poly(beta-D-mannuronate) C5 epimerase
MADRLRLFFLMICAVIVSTLGWVGSANAQTMQDYEAMRSDIAEVYSDLLERGPSIAHPSDIFDTIVPLIERFAIPVVMATAAQPTTDEIQIESIDLRLGLVQLALAVGGNDQLSVVRAQSDAVPKVIVVQSGAVDLETLRSWITAQPEADAMMDGNILNVPLMVSQAARLDLSRGDVIELSTANGAFIVNLGVMVIDGARISATPQPNLNVPDFAPFLATAGTGQAHLSNSVFEGLGFGDTAVFSGVSVINRGLYAPIGQSFLTDSVLRNIRVTTFEGGVAPIIASNVFVGPNSAGLSMRQTSQADIVSNVFLGGGDGPAIRVMDGSTDSVISNNLAFNTAGTALFVTQGSHNTAIVGNLLWQSAGGGISVGRSDCINLSHNITIDSQRKGIELRTSRNSQIVANQMLGNQSSGLFIGDQPVGTITTVRNNLFVGNRFGLSSASADQLSLYGNDFLNQFPRFLEGDLSSQTPKIVANLRGTDRIELTAGGIEMFNIAPVTCQPQMEG